MPNNDAPLESHGDAIFERFAPHLTAGYSIVSIVVRSVVYGTYFYTTLSDQTEQLCLPQSFDKPSC